nr:leucine-rich repeat receptor protein kinase msp1 [Quercus suber]
MDHALQALVAATASFFVVTLIFAFLVILCRKPKKPTPTTSTQRPGRAHNPVNNMTELSSVTDESASFDPNLRISMQELRKATKDFSTDLIIGDGSFGLVYKAQLSSGDTVAIKKLDPDAFQGFREFRAEMETLGKLRHPNIVKILGWCVSGNDRLLIYEFVQKGSLDQWLQQEQDVPTLSWGTRVKIVKGTMGYMPPEYKEGLTAATLEADVYSFGILMFEIATGKRPNLPTLFDGKEVGLVQWARKMLAQNQHMEMVDASLSREDGLIEPHVKQYFEIADG